MHSSQSFSLVYILSFFSILFSSFFFYRKIVICVIFVILLPRDNFKHAVTNVLSPLQAFPSASDFFFFFLQNWQWFWYNHFNEMISTRLILDKIPPLSQLLRMENSEHDRYKFNYHHFRVIINVLLLYHNFIFAESFCKRRSGIFRQIYYS